jgi:PAS domain S-box-containing protein
MKILLLEDNKHDVFLFKNELEINFTTHELKVATSREELNSLLNEESFDIIVSDFSLPDINGLEALQIVKAKQPSIPFIILTGSVNEETAVACIKEGADDYILKHHLKRIVPTINSLLKKYEKFRVKLKSDEQLKTFAANVPDIIIIIDPDYKITFVNKLEDEKEISSVLGKSILEITETEFHQSIIDAIKTVKENGKTGCYETVQNINGVDHYYSNRVAPILENDKIGSFIIISTDETHLRHAITTSTKASKQFQMLFNGMPEGVALHDLVFDESGKPINYIITNVNPQFETILKLNKEDILYKSATEIYGVEKPPFLKEYSDVALTGKPASFEVYFPPLDKHFAISASTYEKGKFATIFTDISDRIKTQQELLESRRKLFTLMSNLPGIAYKCKNDPNWTMEFISQGCYDLTGYDPEDFCNNHKLSYNDIILPEDKDWVWESIQEALQNRASFKLIYRIIHADNSIKWVWEQGRGVFDQEDNLLALEGFIIDVSEKIKAENELIESERKYRDLTNVTSDFVYSASKTDDGNFNIEWIGGAFEKITGYSPTDIINKDDWMFFLHPDDVPDYRHAIENITPCQSKVLEFRIISKSGDVRWIRQTIVCECLVESNTRTKIFSAAEDITEKKELMFELKRALDKAEESSKLKSSLLANLSHEFRTPMTGILGLSEIIKELEESPQILDYVDGIITSSNRLLDTLNAVLELADLEANASEYKPENVMLNHIIEEVYSVYNEKASQKNLTYKLVQSEEPQFVYANKEEAVKLFSKLVDNAIKFTETGKVELRLQKQIINGIENAVVEIEDTGIGIAQEDIRIVFQEFRQASEGFSRNFEGTGLGLSIAKKIIEKLNGEIKLESTPGEGSIFKICLPSSSVTSSIPYITSTEIVKIDKQNVVSEIANIASTVTSEPATTVTLPSILCVEDNFINAQVIKRYLNEDYLVDHAKDAQSCLNKIKENCYDIILMDINLGRGMNGIELSKEIKKHPAYEHIPIVAITGYAMRGDEDKFKAEGFNYYLAKPFSKRDVLNLLKQIFFTN